MVRRRQQLKIGETRKIPCPSCDGLSASPEDSEEKITCKDCNSTGFVDAKVVKQGGGGIA